MQSYNVGIAFRKDLLRPQIQMNNEISQHIISLNATEEYTTSSYPVSLMEIWEKQHF